MQYFQLSPPRHTSHCLSVLIDCTRTAYTDGGAVTGATEPCNLDFISATLCQESSAQLCAKSAGLASVLAFAPPPDPLSTLAHHGHFICRAQSSTASAGRLLQP